MEPIIHKLPLQQNTSFVASTFRTPDFETGLHKHIEYELIFIIEGKGTLLIDNQVCFFESGEIYFLGSNMPHQFQNSTPEINTLIIHFTDDCLGKYFFQIPECQLINQLFEKANYGLKLTGNTLLQLRPIIKMLESATYVNRIVLLLQCLQIISSSSEYTTILKPIYFKSNYKKKECIDKVCKYTRDTFRDPITLTQIATIACMSVPSFCNYFKQCTQKTYITYLNEVRISYACHQLILTNKSVTNIGYECGYSTTTHFHRQFMRLKDITPLQYRKMNLKN